MVNNFKFALIALRGFPDDNSQTLHTNDVYHHMDVTSIYLSFISLECLHFASCAPGYNLLTESIFFKIFAFQNYDHTSHSHLVSQSYMDFHTEVFRLFTQTMCLITWILNQYDWIIYSFKAYILRLMYMFIMYQLNQNILSYFHYKTRSTTSSSHLASHEFSDDNSQTSHINDVYHHMDVTLTWLSYIPFECLHFVSCEPVYHVLIEWKCVKIFALQVVISVICRDFHTEIPDFHTNNLPHVIAIKIVMLESYMIAEVIFFLSQDLFSSAFTEHPHLFIKLSISTFIRLAGHYIPVLAVSNTHVSSGKCWNICVYQKHLIMPFTCVCKTFQTHSFVFKKCFKRIPNA